MASTIKVDNVQNQPGTNIINKCGTTITVGAACNSVAVTGNVVKSNALQASDGGNIVSQCGTTVTLGASGDSIALASGATQTGFGRTGTVDWDTASIKTTGFTAVSGNGYFVNTTSGGVTATLPTSPSAGDIVGLKDYALTFDSNALTIGRGGSAINGGSAADPTVTTEGATVMLVYVDGTKGWIPTQDDTSALSGSSDFLIATGGTPSQSGNCEIRTFTGPGTFCVSSVGAVSANNLVSYMVIAGGGGGGGSGGGGGGGAGGFRELVSPTAPYTASPLNGYPNAPNRITVTASPYSIAVAGGGAGGTGNACSGAGSVVGVNGANSVFSTITSTGGGGGGTRSTGGTQPQGSSGGSGGGNGRDAGNGTGGAGNTPSTTPAQGTSGGGVPGTNSYDGGGGGGAGAVGSAGALQQGGAGGCGVTSSINATPTVRAGGGGGGSDTAGDNGAGGPGGGGIGGRQPGCASGDAGTQYTGSGGGASGETGCGGNGGDGVVIIRYKFQ
jgi:hypothetical protein